MTWVRETEMVEKEGAFMTSKKTAHFPERNHLCGEIKDALLRMTGRMTLSTSFEHVDHAW